MIERKGQSGMTLVELMVASAIMAAILLGLTVATYMVVSATERGNDTASALRDVRNAAYWISNDAQMATSTDLVEGAEPVDSVTLEWTDSLGDAHTCSYELSGTRLQRDYDGSEMTVAWHVASVDFSISGNLLNYDVESAPPGRWEVAREVSGKVCLRAETQEPA